MLHGLWKRRRQKPRELSAYADGELEGLAADRVADRLVFDPAAREELSRLRAVDALVDQALAPPAPLPDPSITAFEVNARLAGAEPVPDSTSVSKRARWTPALVASVGILLTAGVAFAGLKRRGLV